MRRTSLFFRLMRFHHRRTGEGMTPLQSRMYAAMKVLDEE